MIGVVDGAAAATTLTIRGRMLTGIIRACQYEYLFWDGAYQQRAWPHF